MINFRKIYYRQTGKDRGMIPNSIIVFHKQSWMYEARVLSPEERKKAGYAVKNEVVQWKCSLRIDLWIAVLTFEWLEL